VNANASVGQWFGFFASMASARAQISSNLKQVCTPDVRLGPGIACLIGLHLKRTATLMSMLPSHWEWVFVDAEVECGPSPGVEIWPGPYRNYFVIPDVKTMAHVEEWLLGIVDEEGPFDGVFGFSEVGGLSCYTLMLYC
jgi:hypothetical protein